MIAWGLPELLSKWPYRRIALGISPVVVLTVLGICTYRQVSYWDNSNNLFSHALDVTQNNYLAHFKLADELRKHGKTALAIEHFRKVLQLKPNSAIAHSNLGNALVTQQKFKEALSHIKRSLEIEPNNPDTKNNLAWILATSLDPNMRNPLEAVRIAQEACGATDYENPNILDTLGAAYASAGRFAEAIETAQKALNLVGQNNNDLLHAIHGRMDLYKVSKPYIDVPQKAENTVQK
jgi:tetratricopeptide (TPR) repeat protein